MIDVPSSIEEVLALPSVDLPGRRKLPNQAGMYFVVRNESEVAYVGITTASLRRRWTWHHRAQQISEGGPLKIHYLMEEDSGTLSAAERSAIQRFSPPFNRRLRGTPPRSPLTSVRMPVDLHEDLKELAKLDGRTVTGEIIWLLNLALETLEQQEETARPRKPQP